MQGEFDDEHDCFLVGSPFEMEMRDDPQDVRFREVKVAGERNTPVKFNIQKALLKDYGAEIGQHFDLIEEFKRSSAPCLLEIDNQLGCLLYSLGNCLFGFQGDAAYKLLTGELPVDGGIKSEVSFHRNFGAVVRYIKLTACNLILCAGKKLIVFDRKRFLASAGRDDPMAEVELPFEGENEFVRQVGAHNKAGPLPTVLVVTSSEQLLEMTLSASTQVRRVCGDKIRSAVYDETAEFIIALPNANDDANEKVVPHVAFFESGHVDKKLSTLTLDFPREIKRNFFRTFFITDFQCGSYFIASCFYASDDARAENSGLGLVFAINQDLHPKVTMDELKAKKSIQYLYRADIHHKVDTDEDGQIPISRQAWVLAPSAQVAGRLCVLLMNHEGNPFFMNKVTSENKIQAL